MNKELSELKLTEHELFLHGHSHKGTLKRNCFTNAVRFYPDSRRFKIDVCYGKEYFFTQDFIDEAIEDALGSSLPAPTKKELQNYQTLFETEESENRIWMSELSDKYSVDFEHALMDRELYYSQHPEHHKQAFINIFSGSEIYLNYGEGILDFIYADFDATLEMATVVNRHWTMLNNKPKELYRTKIIAGMHSVVDDFYAYKDDFSVLKDTAYASLYSAICPVMFEGKWCLEHGLQSYGDHLRTLQMKYLELIEFCFDKDFFPNALGHLHPAERFFIFKSCRGIPAEAQRTENVSFLTRTMSGKEMPYGMPQQEVMKRLDTPLVPNDDHAALAERLGVSIDDLLTKIQLPHFMNIRYTFETIEDILELEFTKMLEANVRFRKCKRCGRYFIMKGNYDTNYCDSIAPGETRTCQELAAGENYRAKHADDKGLAIYNKYYKRYAARVKVRQIKEDAFKQWKYQAMTKRDECNDGVITPEEYIQWMEDSFPNRKPKQDK